MSKKVRTLLRVSSRQQLHDDDIPIQRAEAGQYMKLHPDWIFDREYVEKAVSAYKNGVQEREVLQEILKDAKEHQFDILLTYMSDRIGRQEEYSFYVAALNQLGIEVWTIKDGQLKTEEHIDKLLNYIRFWQNEGESKKTSMRVRDTQREMIKSGKFVGGKAPYGYRLVDSGLLSNHGRQLKKLEIEAEKAIIVRKIYGLSVLQGMGYERIAKELNRLKIPPIVADKWKPGTIRSILTNPIYMGYLAIGRRMNQERPKRQDRKDWVYSKEQIKELVIIPKEMWEQAQQIREARKARINISRQELLKENEEQHHAAVTTGGRLILSGLAYCGYCGRRLKNGSYCNHWKTKSGEQKMAFTGRYVCPERCAERSCYSQTFLEGIVLEAVENCMAHLKSVNVTEELEQIVRRGQEEKEKAQKAIHKEQKALRLDIQTLEEKLPEAIRGEYCFSAERLSTVIQEKETLYQQLNHKLELMETCFQTQSVQYREMAILSAHPDWKNEFHNADTDKKKMLLFCLINRVEVKDKEIRIKFNIQLKNLLPENPDFGVPE